jgi:hypothetical protein
MKPKISKDKILKKYSLDTACRVWYKNQKGYIDYKDLRHVNWKLAVKITLLFDKPKFIRGVDNGDGGTRDGISFILEN